MVGKGVAKNHKLSQSQSVYIFKVNLNTAMYKWTNNPPNLQTIIKLVSSFQLYDLGTCEHLGQASE